MTTLSPARRRLGADTWRAVAAGPAVAVLTVIVALVVTRDAHVPLRDPDHVAATYFVLVGLGVALLVLVDVALRARRETGTFPPPREAMARVRRERWTLARSVTAGSALLGFYVTYMAYRNLKAVVPLLSDANFDRQLADADRTMFGGHDPATLLHTLLGAGAVTHVFSTAYVAFIVFLPLTIGVALVFSHDLRTGLFYTTAQSINWVLGAASYFLLPSLGPAYADPALFSGLPASEVTHQQSVLKDQRVAFLAHPASATPQAIAAFASLHISMSTTALVSSYLLGLRRRVKAALWAWFALTCGATLYLGWHYLVDDLAGVLVAAAAVAAARGMTGFQLAAARRLRTAQPAAARS
jgi:membrane-associated phospholipid phosphatase